jgi:hypothetical protein
MSRVSPNEGTLRFDDYELNLRGWRAAQEWAQDSATGAAISHPGDLDSEARPGGHP